MRLQKDEFIVLILCFISGTLEADKSPGSNFIQVVDNSVINGSPCCGKLNITADPGHGVWMIHFNKLGSYTITNTVVRNRNTWINDLDPEFIISWCGQFWHIGHRGEAGQCHGYLSTPDNTLCFQGAQNFRHYVHCINEWVDGGPSNIRVQCLDDGRGQEVVRDNGLQDREKELEDRNQKLQEQKLLDIDPRSLE